MTQALHFSIVDVFAETKYAGNQLAVFRGNPDSAMMQTLALEMYYAETTFITQDTPENGGYNVRIFTTVDELPFAGHPTLGTAFVIREDIIQEPVEQVILNLKAGQIPVTFNDDGTLWMRQNAPNFGYSYKTDEMAEVLGLSPDDFDVRFPIQESSTGLAFIMVPLKTLDAVKRATMNLPRFIEMIQQGKNDLAADALLMFCPETEHRENDLHARVFVHLHGIPEDPATGSANGCLAAYLAKHRYFGSPIAKARVEQGYEINRPSLLLLDAIDRDDTIEVNVGGRVQYVAKGQLIP